MNKSIFFNTFIVGLFWSINDDLKKNNVVLHKFCVLQTNINRIPKFNVLSIHCFFWFFSLFFLSIRNFKSSRIQHSVAVFRTRQACTNIVQNFNNCFRRTLTAKSTMSFLFPFQNITRFKRLMLARQHQPRAQSRCLCVDNCGLVDELQLKKKKR